MKLKLITNEGTSNQFQIYIQPTTELLGTFQFNPGDELEFEIEEGLDLQARQEDWNEFQFESGSI
jgi:hypothetical protein